MDQRLLIGQPMTRVLRLESCKLLACHLQGIVAMQESDGKLVTGSLDNTVRLWDSFTGRAIGKFVGHRGGVRSLCMKNNLLVTGGWDGSIFLFKCDRENEFLRRFMGHVEEITGLALLDNMQQLISASMEGTINKWALYDGVHPRCSKRFRHGIIILQAHVLADDPLLIVALTNNEILILNQSNLNELRKFKYPAEPLTAMKAIGLMLVAGGAAGTVAFVHMESCQLLARCNLKNSQSRSKCTQLSVSVGQHSPDAVLSIEYSATGHIFFSSANGLIHEWHLATLTSVRTLSGPEFAARVLCIEERRGQDRIRLFTAHMDGSLRIWILTGQSPTKSTVL
ncbi:hypothetical protein Ciccas_014267 [Cichlidogyrus casuarinus]|uniref:Uncharacterized protein n=1 Tax=Cichlidogyrus casuarinus TaxID=1844966 RepID=A0ABD2PLE7_9PLAT